LEILLIRVKDSVFAVENRCSHDEKPLSDGKIIEKTIECKYHGAKFDIETGKALKMPAVTPVNIFKTKIENGKVFVLID
ncbi:MAG: Rieske 2Fe-2S domain-containing protein, partial [bacterium]